MLQNLVNPYLMIQRTITLDDYEKQCEVENGGIEKVVVFQLCDRLSYTVTNRVITALTMKTGKQAYEWTPDLEHAKADDDGNRSENKSYWRLHKLMVQFDDDESVTAKLDEDSGRVFLCALVKYARSEDKAAKWKAFGFYNGLRLPSSTSGTGQKYEELRGHTLNFEVKELTRALEIDDSLVSPLLNPPS